MSVAIGLVFMWVLAILVFVKLRQRGPDAVDEAFGSARGTLIFVVPRVIVGLIGARFIAELLPGAVIADLFGADSGVTGIVIATIAGALTPGGPLVAFAIAAAAYGAGAATAAVIAYVTGWSLFNVSRTLTYELPVMGGRFLRARWLIAAPLPIVLGVIVQAIASG